MGKPTRVNTTRLLGRDYARAGAYFVTICTKQRQRLFGYVEDGNMVLNQLGYCVQDAWECLPHRFPHVVLDAFVIMPDHLHAIITLQRPHVPIVGAGFIPPALTSPHIYVDSHATLGKIIAYFKYVATCSINTVRDETSPVFQRGYHDHIIRGEQEWNRIGLYIQQNPEKWHMEAA